jgi:hypothetical protein
MISVLRGLRKQIGRLVNQYVPASECGLGRYPNESRLRQRTCCPTVMVVFLEPTVDGATVCVI